MEKKDELIPDSPDPLVETPAGRGRLYPSASPHHDALRRQSTATGNHALDEESPYPFDRGFEFQVKVPTLPASVQAVGFEGQGLAPACQSKASWAANLLPVLCSQERGLSSLLPLYFPQFILPDSVLNIFKINYILEQF